MCYISQNQNDEVWCDKLHLVTVIELALQSEAYIVELYSNIAGTDIAQKKKLAKFLASSDWAKSTTWLYWDRWEDGYQ